MEDIDALALLKEEMETEEVHLKVNAIHRLKTVILCIGVDDTIKKLIPYLESKQFHQSQCIKLIYGLIEKEDDEVLFAIAEELGKVWQLLPDKTTFLGLLETLARVDETVVREQATKSLTSIAVALTDSEIQNSFAPMVIKLATGEWFTGRVSSCSLFFPAYSRSGPQKEKLRKKFVELCNEDTPMIRRACASKIGIFATQLEKPHLIQELLPLFRQLSQDEQDAIRVLCLESFIPMAKYLNKEENQIHTLGTLVAAGEDKSWKVRLAFAKNFAELADSFGKEITDSNLIQTFTQLLNDNEAEVKNAAIQSMTQCLKNLSTEKISNLLLPTLQNSYADAQTSFKAGVAMALSEMAAIVGKDYTANKIMPILMDLIKDENSEVKLNVCNGLIKVASVVGPDVLSPTFLSTLTSMSKEGQWRVRMAVFELIGEMSKLFAKDVFQKHLESLFMSYLNNTAASVRDMGVRKAKELADKYKGDWVISTFIPKVVETYNIDKQGYNYRMCCLQSLHQILPHINKDQTASLVIPIFAKAMKDPIPNVRFTVAKILRMAKQQIDGGTFASQILPGLKEMTSDSDRDVQYYATVAINE